MATDRFRRHARASVDAALHHAFTIVPAASLPFFERLVQVVRARSDLMRHAPDPRREVMQVRVLQNLVPFEGALLRDPESWVGSRGHPLVVVHSLASHLFGRYPVPRFLASAWWGSGAASRLERRRWFIELAGGTSVRRLGLPLALTRRMAHTFLCTPDHYPFDHALRRAEVLGLGGSPELADVLLTTRLASELTNSERWREALAWLVRCDSVDLTQVRPLVDFLHANLHQVDLRGRTFASAMHLVTSWHGWLGAQRTRAFVWPRSRWNPMTLPTTSRGDDPREGEWTIVELLDSRELAREGRDMRHCVSTYAHDCAAAHSSIWSLRYRGCDDPAWRSVLTIEIRPSTGMIVQLRGRANALPRGEPLELVQRWATREGLRFHHSIVKTAEPLVRRAA